MTITKRTSPRLINARGSWTRPLVESFSIDANATAPHPATGKSQWSDPQQAAKVIGEIERICGSKKYTDQQRLAEIQKTLAEAHQVAKQGPPTPVTPLNESKAVALIESQSTKPIGVRSRLRLAVQRGLGIGSRR